MTDHDGPPPVPAMTRAEQHLVDRYLRVVDLLARIRPGAGGERPTFGVRTAAQALVSASRELLAAVDAMAERGEDTVFGSTFDQALLALDGERRTGRLQVRPPG